MSPPHSVQTADENIKTSYEKTTRVSTGAIRLGTRCNNSNGRSDPTKVTEFFRLYEQLPAYQTAQHHFRLLSSHLAHGPSVTKRSHGHQKHSKWQQIKEEQACWPEKHPAISNQLTCHCSYCSLPTVSKYHGQVQHG